MKLNLPDRVIDVFTISPRVTNTEDYWRNIKKTALLSEKYGYSGNLIFTGNDIYVDTWIVANTILETTKSLSPLVAVNPIYMHPFSAAKMISSFAYIFGRKTYINCVTGTSKNDLSSFNDDLEHNDRYDRLREYVEIIKLLLEGEPVTYNGKFYKIKNLQLLPKLPLDLFPEFYLGGASPAAKKTAELIGAVQMTMGKPLKEVPAEYPSPVKPEGSYFGLIVRETEKSAREAIGQLFPDSEEGELMLNYSMSNTDSEWKKELKLLSETENNEDIRFQIKPFKTFHADCPYYMGDYEQIANVIISYVLDGFKSIIIDTPSDEKEYIHIAKAFELASQKLTFFFDKSLSKPTIDFNFNFK